MFYGDEEFPLVENYVSEIQKNSLVHQMVSSNCYLVQIRSLQLGVTARVKNLDKLGSMTTTEEKDRTCSWEKKFFKSNANSGQNQLSGKSTVRNVVISNFVHVKVEPLDNNESSFEKVSIGHLPSDEIAVSTSASIGYGMECLGKMVSSGLDCQPIARESAKPLRINCPQGRRKTATDSVEIALEEDAFGLLQVLVQKGVSVNEITLYGEMESDEALDDLSTEVNFSELGSYYFKGTSKHSYLYLRDSRG